MTKATKKTRQPRNKFGQFSGRYFQSTGKKSNAAKKLGRCGGLATAGKPCPYTKSRKTKTKAKR